VVPGVLELPTTLCPGFFGLLPGHHMPFKRTEPAVERVYPNVDHVLAIAAGGACLDESNHVTACTPCNGKKSNRSGWKPGPIVLDKWDGLTSSYQAPAEHALQVLRRRIRIYHDPWMRELGIVDHTSDPTWKKIEDERAS
jgi:hypothetical protein